MVPAALADIFGADGSIRQFALPFELAPGRVTLYTYRSGLPSARVEWLRHAIRTALEAYPIPSAAR